MRIDPSLDLELSIHLIFPLLSISSSTVNTSVYFRFLRVVKSRCQSLLSFVTMTISLKFAPLAFLSLTVKNMISLFMLLRYS